MSDIALSRNSMMFVTQEGEGFSGAWAGEYRKYGEKKGEPFSDHAFLFHKVCQSFAAINVSLDFDWLLLDVYLPFDLMLNCKYIAVS